MAESDDFLERLANGDSAASVLAMALQPENRECWVEDSRLYAALGRALIAEDHPNRAFDLLGKGVMDHPGDHRLRYLQALALTRCGNPKRARFLVDALLDEPLETGLRSKTLSLSGRLHKERARRTRDPIRRRESARRSADMYGEAWMLTSDPFPAINAATMSLLSGDAAAARPLARSVLDAGGPENDYWARARLGEAHLLLGESREAEGHYRRAVELAGSRSGDIGSMRLQLHLLEPVLPEARGLLDRVFDLGNVVAFAGHMIDHPNRNGERFPNDDDLVEAVRDRIAETLRSLDAGIGYGSVACGADILFCEEILARNGTLHVVLPFDRRDFYRTSVDFGTDGMSSWRERCDDVLRRATEVHYATRGPYLQDDMLFVYAGEYAQGLAVLHAERLGLEATAVCLLDSTALGDVGTATFHDQWRESDRALCTIDLSQIRTAVAPGPYEPGEIPPEVAAGRRRVRREKRAMLFADVKNYSMVNDALAPDFVAEFINRVGDVVLGGTIRPVFQNTWGDGLFFVFEDVVQCAEVALDLLEHVEAADWTTLGLPEDTTIRVGVHAGPVYRHHDRIIDRQNFFGDHVNRTARIEPVTTAGCVFASEQFAAALAVHRDGQFLTEFVGVEELDKDYDRCALYQLQRA